MKNKPKQLKKKDMKMFFFHIKKLKHIPNTKIGDGEKKKKDKKSLHKQHFTTSNIFS
jgi:hypothetical protein